MRLEPFLEHVPADTFDLDPARLADARITVAAEDDPYAPVRRFVELVEASTSLRGFNATPMAPLAFEDFHRQLFEATDTELVYRPAAVERLLKTLPGKVAARL